MSASTRCGRLQTDQPTGCCRYVSGRACFDLERQVVLPSRRFRKPFANHLDLARIELDLPRSQFAQEEPVLTILVWDNPRERDIFNHTEKCRNTNHARQAMTAPSGRTTESHRRLSEFARRCRCEGRVSSVSWNGSG